MAVDTAAKRFSMMDLCRVAHPAVPLPDGTVDASDRLALLWLYSGIAAAEPVTGGAQKSNWLRQAAGRLMR